MYLTFKQILVTVIQVVYVSTIYISYLNRCK